MCFDIIALNIRVSIRVRGLHLVFYFSLKARGSANETAQNATLSHEMRFDRQNCAKIAILSVPRQPFRTKWSSIAKNCGKIAILSVPRQPFVRSPKTAVKLRFWVCRDKPFARNKVRLPKTAIKLCPRQPFRTKWGSIAKNCGKIAIFTGPVQPFRTKWGLIVGNWGRMVLLCVKSVCV